MGRMSVFGFLPAQTIGLSVSSFTRFPMQLCPEDETFR